MPKIELIQGDCLEKMKDIPNESIGLVVTSPPYYLNKEYEKTITYRGYCNLMQECFVQWNRILIGGSYVVVNFGDYFNSGNRFYNADVPSCYPAAINFFKWGTEIAGMDLQATRIWRKQFARMRIPFVCNSHPRPVFDYEHVWSFRKKNGNNKETVVDRKLTQRGVIGENWTSVAGLKNHCAAFPVELPEWAIIVYSNKESVVLDPFMGIGTTGVACKNTNRNFIGIEIDEKYFKIAEKRINENE